MRWPRRRRPEGGGWRLPRDESRVRRVPSCRRGDRWRSRDEPLLNTPPAELSTAELADAIHAGWGFSAATLDYLAVGFGSHHWLATAASGERRFVTVDDLCAVNAQSLAHLGRAFGAARALREEAGLAFVVAPLPTRDGETLVPVGEHFALSVFPFVDGHSFAGGGFPTADARNAVLDLLVRLHSATPSVVSMAGRESYELPSRDGLECALAELAAPWTGGPFSEPARQLLEPRAGDVVTLLGAYDDLVRAVGTEDGACVATHGEPHAGNVMVTRSGFALVDWDTALLGPPERDLWHVSTDVSALSAYTEATGTRVDPDRLALYRLWWDLSEIAGYLTDFRREHARTEDTDEAWENLVHYLRPRERWPMLFEAQSGESK